MTDLLEQVRQKKIINDQARKRSDEIMNYFVIGYFLIGLLFAFRYDTWLLACGIGGVCLLAYYSVKFYLPDSHLYQYILSAVYGIFMAHYIYQMSKSPTNPLLELNKRNFFLFFILGP